MSQDIDPEIGTQYLEVRGVIVQYLKDMFAGIKFKMNDVWYEKNAEALIARFAHKNYILEKVK